MPRLINKKMVKEENYKIGPYLMIFKKTSARPWSMRTFLTKEEAKKYFVEYCKQYGFSFKWSWYVLVECTICYSLPKNVTKGKK